MSDASGRTDGTAETDADPALVEAIIDPDGTGEDALAVVDLDEGKTVLGPSVERDEGTFELARGALVVADGTSNHAKHGRGLFADDPEASGGQWYARNLVGETASQLTGEAEASVVFRQEGELANALASAIDTVAAGMEERVPDGADESVSEAVESYGWPNAKVSMVQWDTEEGTVETFVLGDTSIVTRFTGGEAEHAQAAGVLDRIDARAGVVREWAEEQGHDDPRATQLGFVQATRPYANSPGGYPVARAMPRAVRSGGAATHDVDEVASVTAYTDGFDPLYTAYGTFETPGEMAEAAAEGGPDRLLDTLRGLEEEGAEKESATVHKSDDAALGNVEF